MKFSSATEVVAQMPSWPKLYKNNSLAEFDVINSGGSYLVILLPLMFAREVCEEIVIVKCFS